MNPIFRKDICDLNDCSALPKLPNEITLVILNCLRNLQDVNSFLATSHSALNLRRHMWFIWAKKYGYRGELNKSQEFLQGFFFKVANIARYDAFPRNWRIETENGKINGYLTAEKILNASTSELKQFFNNRWVYHIPELFTLAAKAAGPQIKNVLNSYFVITELLNKAAKSGNLSQIETLCEIVENPNLKSMEFAPIHAAAKAGQGDSIRLLVAYGASVDDPWKRMELRASAYTYYVEEYFHTPLELAYECNNEDAVKALLEYHAKPKTEFIKSCTHAHLTMLKIFLELAPTCPLEEGLESCFTNNRPDSLPCAELLLKHGANPNNINSKGETFLYRSVLKGDLNFTRLFCTFKANLELRNLEGKTPLYIAIKGNIAKVTKLQIVRILCEYGADIHALDPQGRKTMLQHASKSKKMKKLLKSIQAERANQLNIHNKIY